MKLYFIYIHSFYQYANSPQADSYIAAMWIPFISRGMGIVVPFILGACLWIVGIWFPKRTFYDAKFTAWCFLAASVLTALLAYSLFISARRYAGFKKPESIWAHTFFFLPIIFWSAAFLGISIWQFVIIS